MRTYYVYILKCSDDTFYTGITSNLDSRLSNHKQGKYPDSYTYRRRPVSLIYYARFTDPVIAIEAEKQIKKWSQAKKEALSREDFRALKKLARKKFKK